MKILMVCLGNICRSPLAEGILKDKVADYGLNWEVNSAGTGSWHIGELPDRRSISVARKNGIDITDQRARQFVPNDLDDYDLILAMDSSNYQNILKLATTKDQEEKVELILNFSKPGYNANVPDPYWDDDGFEQVFQMLEEACVAMIAHYSKS